MCRVLALILFFCVAAPAQSRQVAITIDDLPRGGDRGDTSLAGIRSMTEKLMEPFREQKIPLIGFVNEGRHQLGPENYVGRGGFSWIHRWSQAKGMANKGEPDPPDWVEKAYSELSPR